MDTGFGHQTPFILCGPMLRRVDEYTVSVFVVTSAPCVVRLRVGRTVADALELTTLDLAAAAGNRRTIRLGEAGGGGLAGMHAAVVTAGSTQVPQAAATVRMFDTPVAKAYYSLEFLPADLELGDGIGDSSKPIFSSGVDREALRLPGSPPPEAIGFALPPQTLGALSLLTGSCRKPHGGPGMEETGEYEGHKNDGLEGSEDALAIAGRILNKARQGHGEMPHLLLLTGDQIYADDVQSDLLKCIDAVATERVGTRELAEVIRAVTPVSRSEVPAAPPDLSDPKVRRGLVQAAGLTTTAKGHLITLGEFYSMYVLCWSPSLWPAEQSDFWPGGRLATPLRPFLEGLPAVAEALAGIATLMIFDDHDVTDDWNLDASWCQAVLSDSPKEHPSLRLARRVVRNALVAYLVFQHWGNCPLDFVGETTGAKLLTLVDGWDGSDEGWPHAESLELLERLLGLPPREKPLIELSERGAGYESYLSVDQQAMRWGYRLCYGPLEIVALDTRTRRAFNEPKAGVSLQALMRHDDAEAALRADASPANVEARLVLSAPPILMPWSLAHLQRDQTHLQLARDKARRDASEEEWTRFWLDALREADFEPWWASSTFRLVCELLSEGPPTVVLSGDIHLSVALALQPDDVDEPAFVNLVVSSLKNRVGSALRAGAERILSLDCRDHDLADLTIPVLGRKNRSPGRGLKGLGSVEVISAGADNAERCTTEHALGEIRFQVGKAALKVHLVLHRVRHKDTLTFRTSLRSAHRSQPSAPRS